jgi:hypothetical protein
MALSFEKSCSLVERKTLPVGHAEGVQVFACSSPR